MGFSNARDRKRLDENKETLTGFQKKKLRSYRNNPYNGVKY